MKFKYLIILTACSVAASCQLASIYRTDETTKTELVDAKYSLAKDRAELDKLRENIPVEIKKKNDEKALIAEWMGDLRYTPESIRDKFSNLIRKKRELFNKDMGRTREDYNKNEKKERDEFLKNLQEERKEFLARKADSERRADFFNDQDEARRIYFAEQREKRDVFESDVREQRKNFDDYIKEKTDDFNPELKNYIILWNEKLQKEKAAKENEN